MHCTVHGAEVAHRFLIGHFSQSQPLCLRSVVTSSRGQSFLLHFRKDIFCVCVEMKMKKGAVSADGKFEIAMSVLLDLHLL